jgi:hypothetical protein
VEPSGSASFLSPAAENCLENGNDSVLRIRSRHLIWIHFDMTKSGYVPFSYFIPRSQNPIWERDSPGNYCLNFISSRSRCQAPAWQCIVFEAPASSRWTSKPKEGALFNVLLLPPFFDYGGEQSQWGLVPKIRRVCENSDGFRIPEKPTRIFGVYGLFECSGTIGQQSFLTQFSDYLSFHTLSPIWERDSPGNYCLNFMSSLVPGWSREKSS